MFPSSSPNNVEDLESDLINKNYNFSWNKKISNGLFDLINCIKIYILIILICL